MYMHVFWYVCACVYVCMCTYSQCLWSKRERERGGRECAYTSTCNVCMYTQVFHRGSSCVTVHLSPADRAGGVAVPLPLVQGSIFVGSVGGHCSQCTQSQGASLCTAHCTYCINLCRYVCMTLCHYYVVF